MHNFGAVVVPAHVTRDEVEKYVEEAMAPFDENTSDDGWWDWWQVGGRWTGVWGEYDPRQDPENIETCRVCGGTGRNPRADEFEAANPGWIEWCNGCNGCKGKGVEIKWATGWRAYDGDIIKASALLNNPLRRPMTLVLPDGRVIHREWWTGKEWCEVTEEEWFEKFEHELEPYRDQAVVVVDYHS